MTKQVFPLWVFVAVAFLTALAAFGLGQISAGLGVPFVIWASTGWVAFAVSRSRKLDKLNG